MKFLLSIPFQLIVVILVAVTVSNIVSTPLRPLSSALSIATPTETVQAPPQLFPTDFNWWPIAIALLAALSTFGLWHLYRFFRSELAIKQTQKAGGRISATNGFKGLMRYIFSDVSISFADRDLAQRKLPELHQIHNLTRLDLSGSGIGQKSLAGLTYCRFLEEVDLRRNGLSRNVLLAFHKKTTAKLLHS